MSGSYCRFKAGSTYVICVLYFDEFISGRLVRICIGVILSSQLEREGVKSTVLVMINIPNVQRNKSF